MILDVYVCVCVLCVCVHFIKISISEFQENFSIHHRLDKIK